MTPKVTIMPEIDGTKRTPVDSTCGTRLGQGWCLPRPVHRFGGKLLEQQLWCWGRDVEFADGNLLMQFGFERHRYRGDADRSTCYRLDSEKFHVCMWGFGMFFGRRDLGGLYVSRFEFCPKWAPVESLSLEVHWPSDLPDFVRPQGKSQWQRACKLWKSLLRWLANYETWVRSTIGLPYRQKCVESWLRPFVRADRMAAAWRFLSRRSWEQLDQPLSLTLKKYTLTAMS